MCCLYSAGGVCTSAEEAGLTTVSQVCRTKSAYLVSLRVASDRCVSNCCIAGPATVATLLHHRLQEDVAHFCLPLEYQLELPVKSGGAWALSACDFTCTVLFTPPQPPALTLFTPQPHKVTQSLLLLPCSVLGCPVLCFEVHSLDAWDRHRVEGYGQWQLPPTPGGQGHSCRSAEH